MCNQASAQRLTVDGEQPKRPLHSAQEMPWWSWECCVGWSVAAQRTRSSDLFTLSWDVQQPPGWQSVQESRPIDKDSMKRALIALAISCPVIAWQPQATAETLHYLDFMKSGVPLRKSGDCVVKSKTFRLNEMIELHGARVLDTCAVPASVVLTENGARGQVLSAWATGAADHGNWYWSWFLEVDCRKMESRSVDNWTFRKDEPDDKERKLGRYVYFRDPGVWVSSQEGRTWSSWSPITDLDAQHKWLCNQWKGSQGGK